VLQKEKMRFLSIAKTSSTGFSILRRNASSCTSTITRSFSPTKGFRNGGKLLFGAAAVFGAASLISSFTPSRNAECSSALSSSRDDPFYPEAEPYNKGLLKVSDIHTIAYSEYGNPKGKPVLFIHGGPGGGTVPKMARFFDPKAYRVILVDQRGCGESTPFANLTDNTTYDSVRDFEKLRKKLGIKKWQLFGGSWGSTLALAYAVRIVFVLFFDFFFSLVARSNILTLLLSWY
jgi:hypothetical protein